MIDGKLVEVSVRSGEFGPSLDQEGRICGVAAGCVGLLSTSATVSELPAARSTKAFSATSHSTYSSYVDHT